MKIGIDLLWLRQTREGGIGTHIRGLLNALAQIDRDNQYVLFVSEKASLLFGHLPPNFYHRIVGRSIESGIRRRVLQQVYVPYYAAAERLDVLHFPANTSSLFSSCPRVITLHDLTSATLGVHRHSLTTLAQAVKSQLDSSLLKATARRAHAIITVSKYSRGAILRSLQISRDRVHVIYNGLDQRESSVASPWDKLAARLGVFGEYIIAFSNQFVHKNLEPLLRAFAALQTSTPLQLVIVGHLPNDGGRLRAIIASLRCVTATGYLEDSDLRAVLSHAKILAFPSLSEGFGLPVLEAMAAGVPVACSKTAALPEIAGDAAVYFDPRSIQEIAAVLQRLCDESTLRDRLIAEGYMNLKRFSWIESARQTLDVYRMLASNNYL